MEFCTVIEPEFLFTHLHDREWAIIDCRFELSEPLLGEQLYMAEHIPNAIYLHLERDLSSPPDGINGRHPLPGIEGLEKLFTSCGIGEGVQVVAYDANTGGYAARLWWLLQYAGHRAVSVLNGGFTSWQGAGYPTKAGRDTRAARDFHVNVQPAMIVDTDEVLHAMSSTDEVIIDSRAPERYRGELEPIDKVAGHIPHALNHYWQENLLPSGKIAPADILRGTFDSLLAGQPADRSIVYCGSGVTACQNILSMEYAGRPGARLYPGSWSAWITDPGRPISTEI
jgi:thiosulfate/3-mercaptopyruvate sulfurtransferase